MVNVIFFLVVEMLIVYVVFHCFDLSSVFIQAIDHITYDIFSFLSFFVMISSFPSLFFSQGKPKYSKGISYMYNTCSKLMFA